MSILTATDDLTAHVFSENLRVFKAWRAKPRPIKETVVGEDALIRGHVETAGFVTPAVVTGTECVAGVITLWRANGFAPASPQLDPVIRRRAVQSFFVVDEAGDRLLVSDPDMLIRTWENNVTGVAQTLAYPATPFYAFAIDHFTSHARNSRYEVTEQLIVPGDPIEVFGRVGKTSWIDQGAYREQLTEVTSMSGAPLLRVVVRPVMNR